MGNYIASTALGLVRRGRPLRAIEVLAQRALDSFTPQRQVVMGKRLSLPFDPVHSRWSVEFRPAEVVAAYFPHCEGMTGDACFLLYDDAVAGCAFVKEAADGMGLDMPGNARFLSHIMLAEGARGLGFKDAFNALQWALYGRGIRWMVTSTNDWNEKMLRACQRSGFERMGVSRRLPDGSKVYRAVKSLHWAEQSYTPPLAG